MPFEGTAMPAAGKAQAETVPNRVSTTRRAVEGAPGAMLPDTELQFFRVPQVAARLNVHRTTVYRAIESGALRAVRFGTGRGGLRVSAAALAEYTTNCEVRPSALVEAA